MMVKYIFSWQHLQKGWWALRKLHMEFVFIMAKLATGQRSYSCLDCWQYAVQTRQAGHKGKRQQNLVKKGRTALQSSCFIEKNLPNILQDTQESNCWILPRLEEIVLQNSFNIESTRHSRSLGQRWILQYCRGTLSEYPRSQISLSFLMLIQCLTLIFSWSVFSMRLYSRALEDKIFLWVRFYHLFYAFIHPTSKTKRCFLGNIFPNGDQS